MDLAEQLMVLRSMLWPALLSASCGAVVGLERELRDKPAGLKTHALICLGSAMYVYLGELMVTTEVGTLPAFQVR